MEKPEKLSVDFFGVYWYYFALGLVIYISAKMLYIICHDKGKFNKLETIEKELDALEECNSKDLSETEELSKENSESEEEISPALPHDLRHVPLTFDRLPLKETIERSEEFYKFMNMRRTVRHFSKDDVPIEVIHNVIKTAGTAPSGAHTEPWTYVAVKSPEVKQQIRAIIEEEEEINYKKRMGKVWTADLKPLKTDWIKEYLTDAPYLILVFKQMYSYREDGKKRLHYYNEQSVSLSTGMLLTAIHYAGLATLTSTPLNCGAALRRLLDRPVSEKLSILLPVGYPAKDCLVPDLQRKPLEDILIEI